MKNLFDKTLLEKLKVAFLDETSISVNKAKILIKTNSGSGELCFVYSTKGAGYYLVITADNTELQNLVAENPPPYPPKILAKHNFCFSTLEEKHPIPPASAQSKLIQIPNRDIDIALLCDRVVETIKSTYLPLIRNFIDHSAGLVDNITSNKSAYAYPLFSVLICMKKSGIKYDESVIKTIEKNKLIGKKDFDLALMMKYLT